MVYILIRDKSMGSMQNISAGLILGALNFANIALYVKAHMLLKDSPAVVFAGMNILVVLFGVISGVLFFKEKLKNSFLQRRHSSFSGIVSKLSIIHLIFMLLSVKLLLQ
ncbi:Uncharacterised protein [Mycobacteroides abscessus subsp. abscessus]|nr:Uncharacterised protein [Mycobacteroides abscessus subsp. abscessus]